MIQIKNTPFFPRATRIAVWYNEFFNLLYKKSDLEGLPEKLVICLKVTKSIYTQLESA